MDSVKRPNRRQPHHLPKDTGIGPAQNQERWHLLLEGADKALNPDMRLKAVTEQFPMRINSYFRSLITSTDDPLGRQVIPDPAELTDMAGPADPLAEESQSPVPQVIHRYPHRVAFLVSNQCAIYCRFCMRKRRVADPLQVTPDQIETGLTYIQSRPDINEVVLTGGDPLMLADERLLEIVTALRRMDHVRIVRIHSRIPVALPQRIQPPLVKALALHHPLFINIHVNHPDELTPQADAVCMLMADAGIALGSQTVLLKGVNDDPDVLGCLMEKLLTIRVRPYYIHQLDRVPGTAHFQVPLEKSIRLVNSLRGTVSGMAVPHLMVDLPRGGGKVALTAGAVVKKNPDQWQIRNWQGNVFDYPV